MDPAQLAQGLTDIKKSALTARTLLLEIERLDTDRAANLVRLRERLSRLQAAVAALQGASSICSAMEEWQAAYQNSLRAFCDRQAHRFAIELQQELQAANKGLSGHLPELRSGMYTLVVDPERWQVTVWLGPKQERLTKCALSAPEVAGHLERLQKELGCRLDEAAFVGHLEEALRRLQSLADADGYVPIVAALGELAFLLQDGEFRRDPRRDAFRTYSRADLSTDLYHFRRRVQLRIATRAQARSRDNYLWVPSDERKRDGAIYSHIRLRGRLDE